MALQLVAQITRDHTHVQVDVYEKASRVGGMTYTEWDTAPLVDHNVDKTNQVLCMRICLSHSGLQTPSASVSGASPASSSAITCKDRTKLTFACLCHCRRCWCVLHHGIGHAGVKTSGWHVAVCRFECTNEAAFQCIPLTQTMCIKYSNYVTNTL